MAELLETRSFISAPLLLRKSEGRIYVVSDKTELQKTDALFLNDIAVQAFPVIENIELLDQLASGAALRERQKIARDLHDSTIQPYIGLKHGLEALRKRASQDNPLAADLERLTSMTTQVIQDMVQYGGKLATPVLERETVLLVALRRQAAHLREFYGIDIEIRLDRACEMNDRLAAEVFQIAIEGMCNIRKHTKAQSGHVWLSRANGCMTIRINNERLDRSDPATGFSPRSITERARALGGRAYVLEDVGGSTVHVEIPV